MLADNAVSRLSKVGKQNRTNFLKNLKKLTKHRRSVTRRRPTFVSGGKAYNSGEWEGLHMIYEGRLKPNKYSNKNIKSNTLFNHGIVRTLETYIHFI